MRELNHVPFVCDNGPGSLAQCADAAITPSLRRQIMSQSCYLGAWHREAKLVVITACQGEFAGTLLTNRTYEIFRHGNVGELDVEAATAGLGELACITEEAIGDVDARCRVAAQAVPKCEARR